MLGGMSESVAALVTVNNVNSATVRFVCAGSTGALFTSVTTTVKLFVALRDGVPLSLTIVVIAFVLGPCVSVGVQVMIPFASITAPDGGLTKEYIRTLAGLSESIPVLVTVNDVSSATVRLVWAMRAGALFTSVTTTVKLFVALSGGLPLSVTIVLSRSVPGPCASD